MGLIVEFDLKLISNLLIRYRISAESAETILFLEVGVQQVFKGGHYLSEEAILFSFFFNLENAAIANS